MSVPKYETSATTSRAASRVTPLCWRSSWYSSANEARRSVVIGSMMVAAEMSTPRLVATALISVSSPRSVSSAMPRRSTVAAARRTRGSAPSGRTMRRGSERARSTSSYWNINGVTAPTDSMDASSSTPSMSIAPSTSASAVSILAAESAWMPPRASARAAAVEKVSSRVDTTGSCAPTPSMSRHTSARGCSPPVSTSPASDGNASDRCADSIARTMSSRSPGVTTTDPSVRWLSTLGSVMAATTTSCASRDSRAWSPSSSSPSMRAVTPRMLGASSRGASGSRSTGTSRSDTADRVATMADASVRLTMTRMREAWLAASTSVARSMAKRTSCGLRWCAVTTNITGEPRLAATRALNCSSAGAPTSVKSVPSTSTALGLGRQRPVAIDDDSEGVVRGAEHVGVGDAEVVGVRQVVDAATRAEQLDGCVRLVPGAHHWAEDSDVAGAAQRVLVQAERHGGLAAVGLGGGDVEASGHACSPY